MDPADLKLRPLSYLIAVVDQGHFGKAAAQFHVSTPTLSRQIRRLEAQVGMQLLERARHPICPTQPGQRFVAEARECLAAAGGSGGPSMSLAHRWGEQVVVVPCAAGRSGSQQDRARALLDRHPAPGR